MVKIYRISSPADRNLKQKRLAEASLVKKKSARVRK